MAERPKITIRTLQGYKRDGRKISMLTCYDFSTARLMEEAGVDSLLIGDTYGEVCLGFSSTLPVKLDHLVTLAAGVRRGAPTAYLVGDMPYLSYQVSREESIRNAGRYMADGGCDCVKVEVDRRLVKVVSAMSAAGIPVMAHLGLRPQWVNTMGGYVAQGKTADEALRLVEDAKMMEEAGAVALLLEAVPGEVAKIIARESTVPVIGIACGPDCDGQVAVVHDMLGYSAGHPPKSIKRYAQVHDLLVSAFRAYAVEVGEKIFPEAQHSIPIDPDEFRKLKKALAARIDEGIPF